MDKLYCFDGIVALQHHKGMHWRLRAATVRSTPTTRQCRQLGMDQVLTLPNKKTTSHLSQTREHVYSVYSFIKCICHEGLHLQLPSKTLCQEQVSKSHTEGLHALTQHFYTAYITLSYLSIIPLKLDMLLEKYYYLLLALCYFVAVVAIIIT